MIRSSLVLWFCVSQCGLAFAQFDVPDWNNALKFDLVTSQEPIRAGDIFEIAVIAEIKEGYHLYGPEELRPSRTEVDVSGEGLDVGAPMFPPAKTMELDALGTYELYEGTVMIRVPLSLGEEAPAKSRSAKVSISYQLCTEFACSAPATKDIEISFDSVLGQEVDVRKLHPEIFTKKK